MSNITQEQFDETSRAVRGTPEYESEIANLKRAHEERQVEIAKRIQQKYDEELAAKGEIKGEIVDGIAMINGRNIFAGVSNLGALTGVFAGYCSNAGWEDLSQAGEFQEQNINAGVNAFAQRATDILWSRMYAHMSEAMRRHNPSLSQEAIDTEIGVLVQGMDLWS